MSSSRAFLSLLGLLALAQSRAAQSDLFSEAGAEHIAWPASVPVLAKGRMVAGDVTGDLLPDALLLNGSKAVIVYGPAIYRSLFELDLEANDVAYVPSSEERRAHFVAVNSEGVWLLADYDAGSFDTTHLVAPSWAGASRVAVGDMDGDGTGDLVGLSATGDLLVLMNPGSPGQHETVLPMTATVFDFAPIDWDEDPADRIALLSSAGFFVLSATGEVIDFLEGGLSGGIVAPIRQPDFAQERCAAVFSVDAAQALVVVDDEDLDDESALPLGAAGVFGAAVSDVDGDGYDDLHLVHRLSHETVLFLNTAGSAPTTYAAGHGELVDVAPGLDPSPAWSAWPELFDFSLDGDPDLLLYVEATGELVFVENTSRSVESGQVTVTGGAYVLDLGVPEAELGLWIQAPAELDFVPTHVQVIGWVQLDADDGGLVADASAVVFDLFALNAQQKASAWMELPEVELYTSDIYHFDVRAVRVEDPERGPIASGPPAVHAFTTPLDLVTGLEQDFGPGTDLRVSVLGAGRPRFMRELGPLELVERSLAPKEVKTPKVPVIDLPPDPFQ